MAHFSTPCQKSSLIEGETAPMPTLILSTYATDFISPQLQSNRQTGVAKRPDRIDESAGRRILPTTFSDIYHNCVSASIGDTLELQFTDDTPEWKRSNRAAAARYWIHALEDRRKFAETKVKKALNEAGNNNQQENDGNEGGEQLMVPGNMGSDEGMITADGNQGYVGSGGCMNDCGMAFTC